MFVGGERSFSYPVLFFFSAGVFSVLSFSVFGGLAFERLIFKTLTFLSILLALAVSIFNSRTLFARDISYIYSIVALFLIIFLANFFNQPDSSLILMFRFMSVLCLTLVLFTLSMSELRALLSLFFVFAVFVAIISILFFFSGLERLERFPLLGWYSNKSIFFEQNVFGIFMYLALVCFLYFSRFNLLSSLIFCILIFAVFMSFYRTVYGLSIFVIVLRLPYLLKFFFITVAAIVAIDNFVVISEALKFDQLITLTGRTELWSIGWVGFADSPFIGLGEMAIPDFSNRFLHRNPPFTTFHNVFVDIIFSAGIFGAFSLVVFLFSSLYFIGSKNFLFFFLLMAPSLFNTFIPFSPNILGLFTGALIILLHRDRTLFHKSCER